MQFTALLLLGLAACADSSSDNVENDQQSAAKTATEPTTADEPSSAHKNAATSPAQIVAPTTAGPSELAAPPMSGTELAAFIDNAEPAIARDKSLRFSDARLVNKEAAPLLAARLRDSQDKSEVKHALILALPKTKGQYAQTVLDLLQSEPDTSLRVDLVDSLRLSTEPVLALKGLKLALTDKSPAVRTRAVFAIGRRPDGASLGALLITALSDSSPKVQSQSARALGNLSISEGFDALLPLLSHREATVRLEVLRAMARIDGERAASLSELGTLENDLDSRVRTAAAKVLAKAYTRP